MVLPSMGCARGSPLAPGAEAEGEEEGTSTPTGSGVDRAVTQSWCSLPLATRLCRTHAVVMREADTRAAIARVLLWPPGATLEPPPPRPSMGSIRKKVAAIVVAIHKRTGGAHERSSVKRRPPVTIKGRIAARFCR